MPLAVSNSCCVGSTASANATCRLQLDSDSHTCTTRYTCSRVFSLNATPPELSCHDLMGMTLQCALRAFEVSYSIKGKLLNCRTVYTKTGQHTDILKCLTLQLIIGWP